MPAMHPQELIASRPMRPRQVLAIALAVALNALDGFDVLSISFASPGIAREWGIDRAALGVVLSMELIGMALGSVLLGGLADRYGRRPLTLASLALMASGMASATAAGGVVALAAIRLATGIGIGGMLATTNAIAAEFSSARRRNIAVALMAGGYPLGAVIGGTLASSLLAGHDWRSVFALGACFSAGLFPLVLAFLPESVAWLATRRPPGAAMRIDRILAWLGHDPVACLPDEAAGVSRGGFRRLFARDLAPVTLLLTLGYFAHILTFYFILKWTPKIVADLGFAPSAAGGVLVWANVGGLIGAVSVSLLTQYVALRTLTVATMLCAALLVALFGRSAPELGALSLYAAAAGCCTNGAIVSLYALFARAFPTELRASGTGFVIGIGRGGAALSPILAGLLFAHGSTLSTVAAVMAAGSLVAAIMIGLLPRR